MSKYNQTWMNTFAKYESMPNKTPADRQAKEYIFHRMQNVAKQHVKEFGKGTIPLKAKILLSKLRGDPEATLRGYTELSRKQKRVAAAQEIQRLLTKQKAGDIHMTSPVDDVIVNANKVKAQTAADKAARKTSWRNFGTALKSNKWKAIGGGAALLGVGALVGNALSKKTNE